MWYIWTTYKITAKTICNSVNKANTYSVAPDSNAISSVVLALNEFGGKFVKRIDLFLLGCEGLLKVLLFLDESLNIVKWVPQVLISQEHLQQTWATLSPTSGSAGVYGNTNSVLV